MSFKSDPDLEYIYSVTGIAIYLILFLIIINNI